MRLIQQLTSAAPDMTWTGPIEALAPAMRAIRSCPALYADDAFSIFEAENGTKFSTYEGFGCVRPPFPALWIEGGRYGAFVRHYRGASGFDALEITGYGMASDGGIVGPLSHHTLDLDASGVCMGTGDKWYSPEMRDLLRAEGHEEFNNAAFCSLFALSLCHDRELTIRRAGVVRGSDSRAESSAVPRPATVEYYVLSIKPTRRTRKCPPSMSSVIERKLHSVRGHWMIFTADRPAFGKLTGKLWCPPHRRGSIKRGMVVKDYQIA